MAQKVKNNMKEQLKAAAEILGLETMSVPTLDELRMEAVVSSHKPIDRERVNRYSALSKLWEEFVLLFAQLNGPALVKSDRGHRGYVHNILCDLDPEYKEVFGEMRQANKRLHDPMDDGKKREPHHNSSLAAEEEFIWQQNKEDRIDRYIDDFNELVKKSLNMIPEDIREPLMESDRLYKEERSNK